MSWKVQGILTSRDISICKGIEYFIPAFDLKIFESHRLAGLDMAAGKCNCLVMKISSRKCTRIRMSWKVWGILQAETFQFCKGIGQSPDF